MDYAQRFASEIDVSDYAEAVTRNSKKPPENFARFVHGPMLDCSCFWHFLLATETLYVSESSLSLLRFPERHILELAPWSAIR